MSVTGVLVAITCLLLIAGHAVDPEKTMLVAGGGAAVWGCTVGDVFKRFFSQYTRSATP